MGGAGVEVAAPVESEDHSSASEKRRFASPFASVLLRPKRFVATLVIASAAIGGLFVAQPTTYNAGAVLTVGRIDVPANAVPGYVNAANTLAGSYSRFVGSISHLDRMAELAGVSRDVIETRGSISASNVPEASIIRIEASSTVGQEQAVRLAELAATALADVVAGLNATPVDGVDILEDHASTARALVGTREEVERLQRTVAVQAGRGSEGAADLAAAQEQLNNANAVAEQLQLQLNTFATLYIESQRFRVNGNVLNTISGAYSEGDSRASSIQLGVVAGLVGGATLALSFTWLSANGALLRAARAGVVERYGPITVPAGPPRRGRRRQRRRDGHRQRRQAARSSRSRPNTSRAVSLSSPGPQP